jgi:hypothetical protein
MNLPFAMQDVEGRFSSAVVNAIEPDSFSASALIRRLNADEAKTAEVRG